MLLEFFFPSFFKVNYLERLTIFKSTILKNPEMTVQNKTILVLVLAFGPRLHLRGQGGSSRYLNANNIGC